MPERSRVKGDILPFILLIINTRKVENKAPRKENTEREWGNRPSRPRKRERVTKKFAPDDIPKRYGSARGFRNRVWERSPARESEAPTKNALITLGSLTFKIISSPFDG